MMVFSTLPAQLKWRYIKAARTMKTLHRVMLITETLSKHPPTVMIVNIVVSIEVRIYIFLYIFSLNDLYFIFIYHLLLLFIFAAPHTFLATFQMLMKFLDFLIRLLALATMPTSPRVSQDTLLERGVFPQYLPLPTRLM
jgi:hypothetical protein